MEISTNLGGDPFIDNRLCKPSDQLTNKYFDESAIARCSLSQVDIPIGNMDLVIRGELMLENGCLRVNEASLATGGSFLLIWDENFTTRNEQGVVQVIDAHTGEVLASVGDYVEIGGGKAPADIQKYLKQSIPIECPEPYWLVGEPFKKTDRP